MDRSTQHKKITYTATEIVNLLGELNLNAQESLEVVTKVMHFIIEKGFCQTEAKTSELVAKALGTTVITSAISQN